MRMIKGFWISGMVMMVAASCTSKAKKSQEIQEAIARMNQEHQEQISKKQNGNGNRSDIVPMAERADGIAARVNEDVIFISELDEAVRQMLNNVGEGSMPDPSGPQLQKARHAVLQRLIDRKLLEQEAKKREIKVSEEEVDQTLEKFIADRGLSKEQFYIQLAASKKTIEEYRAHLRRELMVYKMMNMDINRHIQVGEDEIRSYYEAHPDEFAQPGGVRIKQIVLLTRGDDPEEKLEKRQKIEEIHTMLQNGRKFEDLAREYSQGPNGDKGGDCGYFKKGEMLGELEETAFSLQVGEVSPVIETAIGFHILQVTDRSEGGAKSLEEVKDAIKSRLEDKAFQEALEKKIEELKEKSYIDIRI
jgi:peptidyl-prolyl cis-trans isomerase SurA